jgi:hypothetical protein
MSAIAVSVDTPLYVLMEGNSRIGPRMANAGLAVSGMPIYGFSAPSAYERFRANSVQAFTPYPLVKVYLRLRMVEPGGNVELVVIDAAGPRDDTIHAVTVEAVLAALETGTTRMTAEYALEFDQKDDAYRILGPAV